MTGNRLLDDIPADEFALLLPHLRDVSLEKETILMDYGDKTQHLYFPLSGLISCFAVTAAGEQLEIYAAGPHDVIGLAGAWSPRQFLRSKVQVAGTASIVGVQQFLPLLGRMAVFRERVFAYLDGIIRKISQRVSCAYFHEAQHRLSLWLALASHITNETDLACTQESIAEAIGSRRATVTVMLGNLEEKGIVRRHRGHITLVNRNRLQDLACECLQNLTPDSGW